MDNGKRNPVGTTLKAALAALVVVVAAGAFAWGIRTGLERNSEAVKPVPPRPLSGQVTTAPAETAQPKAPSTSAVQPAAEVRVQPAPVKVTRPPETVSPQPQPQKTPTSMTWPYQGGVLRPFGWAYSTTMGDWRFHQGIDIAGNDGDEVVAAMGGRVESVEDSAFLGTRIVLSHPSGLKTVYTGVKDVLVKVGDNVQTSQPLASIGRGPFECLDPDHLHFEVITGKENVDPGQFLR
ncbi:MAG: peptidoglycan DD-metalloendopeptidase family protein [Ignavibacteriales bacterium]